MNTHTMFLPDDGHGYTAPADAMLSDGGWHTLIRQTAQALQGLSDEVIAWFCPLATGGEENQSIPMVGLIISGIDTPPDLSATGLRHVDSQPLPDMAFPALMVLDGHAHRVWLDDEDGPISLYLHQDQAGAEVENLAVESTEELAEVEPAKLDNIKLEFDAPDLSPSRTLGGDLPGDLGADAKHIESLKIAFIWQFVYMVIQADGEIDEREAQFLQNLFPTDLLSGLDLVDARGEFKEPDFTLAKTEALQVLPTALNLEERIQMLKVLKQAAWADGIVLPEETRVFRMARQLLNVPKEALN